MTYCFEILAYKFSYQKKFSNLEVWFLRRIFEILVCEKKKLKSRVLGKWNANFLKALQFKGSNCWRDFFTGWMEIYQVFAYFFFVTKFAICFWTKFSFKREALIQKFSPSKIVGWQIQILNKEIASLTI
jgi:hypothetical protein